MQKLFNICFRHSYLFLVLIVAIILRFLLLDQNPPALNWDEVSHGYNAYSILKTGKDEWGNTLPSIFRAYGDYKLPVYIYLTSISVYFFGLSEFAVRLVSALSGIVTVLFTYLLCLRITNDKNTSVWSSFLVAIEPWTLFISRGAFEANLALTFIVSGVFFFFQALRNSRYFIVSFTLLGLSVWTYNSARVFVPLLLFFLFFLYQKEIRNVLISKKITVFISLIPLALFFIPMVYQLLNEVGQARYSKVSIIDQGAIYLIEQQRVQSTFPPLITELIYNRYTYFSYEFLKNIGTHYTPGFLFLEGGTQYQFSIPGRGILYITTAPFLLIGLLLLIKRHDKSSLLLLLWIFAGSIPSSITREAPHVLRSITMLPVPMIITAIGFTSFVGWFKKSKSDKRVLVPKTSFSIIFAIVLLLSLENYITYYFNEYRKNYSWSWQYGYKEAVDFAKKNESKYDHIIITKKYGEPHEFFLFYNAWDPEDYRSDQRLIRYAQADWFWVDRFDKYWFINDWQVKDREDTQEFITESKKIIPCRSGIERCLLITSPNNAPRGWSKINEIVFLNGKTAFEMYEN